MTQENNDILSSIDKTKIDSEAVQELLNSFKETKSFNKDLIENLDGKDGLSNEEQIIKEKIEELGNIEDQIKFLDELVGSLNINNNMKTRASIGAASIGSAVELGEGNGNRTLKQELYESNNLPVIAGVGAYTTSKEELDENTKEIKKVEEILHIKKDTTIDEIKKTMFELNIDKLKIVQNFFLIQKSNMCLSLINNMGSTEIYPIFIEALNTQIELKIYELLNKRGVNKIKIDKIKNQLEKARLNKDNTDGCKVNDIKNINNILEENGIKEINVNDKNILNNILELSLMEDEVNHNEKKKELEGKIGMEIEKFQLLNENEQEKLLKEKGINLSEIASIIGRSESLKKQRKNIEIINNANEEEYKKLLKDLKDGKSGRDIINNLKISIEKREKEKQQNNESKQTINENENINKINSFSNYEFNLEGDNPSITTGSNTNIQISKQEAKMIEKKPELAENIINFYDFFKDLNLLSVWKYRAELTKSIGDLNINIDDDFLKNEEILKMGNKIIDFVNSTNNKKQENKQTKILNNATNINNLKSILREYSGSNSLFSDEKDFNKKGEDIFAANLRNLGIIGTYAGFETSKFRDMIA